MKSDGLSDFLKFAYQCGKVEEIQKTFEEFLVEEEPHQGKIENLLTVAEESDSIQIVWRSCFLATSFLYIVFYIYLCYKNSIKLYSNKE